jgi:DNA-binding CsgD family transcriptional regulator
MLVARDTELAELQQRLLRVGELGAGVVLVQGGRGSGVSALLDRLAAEHRAAGGVTRSATGVPWEHDVAGGLLGQLVDTPDAPTDAWAAADWLAGLLAGTSGTVLLVVDDAEWSDAASVQALLTTVRHHRQAPLLVVLGCCREELRAPRDTAEALARVTDELVLAALDATGMKALATAYGVPLHPTLAEGLCRFTGGRPGPACALLDELPGHFWTGYDPAFPAPRSVQAVVAERLDALPEGARALVDALAVLGEESLPVLAALAGQPQPLAGLDAARAAGLVAAAVRGGATYAALSDPMTTAAVREVLGHRRQAELHRAAADLVEDPVARLMHLAAATPLPDPALADELESLAQVRAATGEWRSVADLLARAARLTIDPGQREDRLARAFDALVGAGDTHGASVAVAEVESLRETPLRNAVLGYLAVVRGRPGEAEQRLERAWDIVNAERDPDTAALVCQRWVLHCLARSRGEDLVTWADRAIALAPAGSPAVIEAKAIRGLGDAATGHGREALADYLRLADEVGHGAQAQRVAMARGWLHLGLDEVEEARAALASALPTDYLRGSTRISLWAHAWLARAQFVAGDWDDALATADQGLVLAERTGMRLIEPLLWWTVAQVGALRGDWPRADEAVRRGDAGPRDYEIMRVPALLARAAVAEARADYASVLRALEPLRQPWAGGSIDEPGAWPWADVYANALVVQGRYDDADAFLVPHERLADERDHSSARARLAYARGRLLGTRGDLSEATGSFERAASLLADLSLPYDRARVHFAWGQSLRRAGKRREADAVLQTARELYDGLGAATYVERCDRELRAGGVHTSRVPAGEREVDGLTPQEQLVSDLVARGMTNREVASELFVSTKTVQYHLTRIYAKLGIRSRGELAAMRGPTPKEPEQT